MAGINARSALGSELVFLANAGVAKQPTAEAQKLVDGAKASTVACGDCEQGFKAGELDISTGLCEVCYEVAGAENEVQDGKLSEEGFEKLCEELGYRGSA